MIDAPGDWVMIMRTTLRHRRWMLIACICSLTLAGAGLPEASAADLRGRILKKYSNSAQGFPVGGARIELYRYSGPKRELVGTAISAQDGIYFFRNIPAGSYSITVPGGQTYTFKVANSPQQDLAPVVLE